MKAKFGREIALLSLPVLLFGGVALLRSMNGRGALPSLFTSNPFDPGPMRLEYSPFQTVDVSPRDAANGFDWATQTFLRERGKWDVPSGWKSVTGSSGYANNLRLVYRRGKLWKQAPHLKSGEFINGSDGSTIRLVVNLENVPRDADEVRVRGQFQNTRWYSGPLPMGWKPPKNLQIAGPNRILIVKSKPFDIPIKLEGEPMPVPAVSRESQIEAVSATWIHHRNWDRFELHLRHQKNFGWKAQPKLFRRKMRLLDAQNREVPVYIGGGRGERSDMTNIDRVGSDYSQPDTPQNEIIVAFIKNLDAPKGGWEKVKRPLWLQGELDDGECWPAKFKIRIEKQDAP